MDISLTEEQQLLQDSARDFLRQECPTTHVRAMEEDLTGYSPELWQKITELGWAGGRAMPAAASAPLHTRSTGALVSPKSTISSSTSAVPNRVK